MPAITKNHFGHGITYYVGTKMSQDGLAKVLDEAITEAGVSPLIPESTELEITYRRTDNHCYYFLINFKEKDLTVPSVFIGKTDLLSGEIVKSGDRMGKYDVKILV